MKDTIRMGIFTNWALNHGKKNNTKQSYNNNYNKRVIRNERDIKGIIELNNKEYTITIKNDQTTCIDIKYLIAKKLKISLQKNDIDIHIRKDNMTDYSKLKDDEELGDLWNVQDLRSIYIRITLKKKEQSKYKRIIDDKQQSPIVKGEKPSKLDEIEDHIQQAYVTLGTLERSVNKDNSENNLRRCLRILISKFNFDHYTNLSEIQREERKKLYIKVSCFEKTIKNLLRDLHQC
mmetsp:Transcript_7657/g.11370  ORF Transcript_7657/g.11370 Transcript_7657/m.11370 type:complete len:234 (+) Transcript_7657:19-720(+)